MARKSATGKLYVVGTPIGNLRDLSPRGLDAFSICDTVLCEDTRVTGKLLRSYGLFRPLERCDENVIAQRAPELVDRMRMGEVFAFASDAGMPGVSDPGQVLVDAAREAGMPVEVLPGPVACVTALVSSGIACEHFYFEGFLPRKAGERERRLAALSAVPGALLFYESPHRVLATLESVARVFPARTVALCRELTKLHEEVLRSSAADLVGQLRKRVEKQGEIKGEIVLVVGPPADSELEQLQRFERALIMARRDAAREAADEGAPEARRNEPADRDAASSSVDMLVDPDAALARDIASALDAGESPSAAAKRLSQRYGRRRRDVYDLILERQRGAR